MKLVMVRYIYVVLLLLPRPSSAWVVLFPSSSTATPSFRKGRGRQHSNTRCLLERLLSSLDDSNGGSTWETALAVVPPDEAWDRLQRARHVAMDQSNRIWPPALRLFHPFCEDLHTAALQIAEIIEKYQIEPFEVTLSEWCIVPHVEAMEAHLRTLQEQALPEQEEEDGTTTYNDDEMDEVQALIAREVQIGREKLRMRQRRKQRNGTEPSMAAPEQSAATVEDDDDKTITKEKKKLLKQQRAIYEEFNGPCVIVLEPDEISKERLQAVRHLLKQELPNSHLYADDYSISGSVSSSVLMSSSPSSSAHRRKKQSTDNVDDEMTEFRPVVPIAAFQTVFSAIAVARKLRNLWDPLTFNVTDLHLLSCRPDAAFEQGGEKEVDGLFQEYYGRYNFGNAESSSSHIEELHRESSGKNQFGCVALVSFIGEEVETDQELNQDMANLVFEKGEAGGFFKNEGTTAEANIHDLGTEQGKSGGDGDDLSLNRALEQWLFEEDEDHDEGMVVVIGRTQFFTGEMREYVGMPASSALDSRDQLHGEQFVSGAARRRGSVHRAGERFNDGDWGRKENDLSPWGRHERSKRALDDIDSFSL